MYNILQEVADRKPKKDLVYLFKRVANLAKGKTKGAPAQQQATSKGKSNAKNQARKKKQFYRHFFTFLHYSNIIYGFTKIGLLYH